MKKLLFMLTIMTVLALTAQAAQADPLIIDFGTGGAPSGGTIMRSGTGWVGTGINLGDVLVVNAPLNNGVFDTSGTGSNSLLPPDTNGSAVLNFNSLTGIVSVIGGIPAFGIANGTTLLSGTGDTFGCTLVGVGLSCFGSGPDTKSPTLLTALGVPTGLPFDFFGFTLAGSFNSTLGVGTSTSSDFSNSATVPEPGSLFLLGGGLIALAGFRFKKNRA